MLKQVEQEQQKTISLTGAFLVRFYLQVGKKRKKFNVLHPDHQG